MHRQEYESVIVGSRNIPLDGTWRAWVDTHQERDIENQKRAAQHEVSRSIRQEIADWRKAVRYHPKKHGISRMENFFEAEVNLAGKQFIQAIIKSKDTQAIANRWSHDKTRYPYFTTFVINMLYIAHHAMTKVNDRIDFNAQADLDLMTHLLHADVLVSNETGFLRKAFDDLWRPRRKVLFTVAEFTEFIRKL